MILSSLPGLSLQILDHAKQHGRVTMADMIKMTGVSRNTLKEHFRTLLEEIIWCSAAKAVAAGMNCCDMEEEQPNTASLSSR